MKNEEGPSHPILSLVIPLALSMLASCSSSDKFSGSGARTENAESEVETLRAQEKFSISGISNEGKVDIVWVVDNSISMSEEVGHVRRNFKEFIDKASSQTNLKVALISSTDTILEAAVLLPPSAAAAGHIQIAQSVGSTDLLVLAAAASCPAMSSQVDIFPPNIKPEIRTHRVCGQDIEDRYGSLVYTIENPDAIEAVKGTLTSFFRSDAKRVYVFVTDDDALGVRSKDYITEIANYNNSVKPFVFAFRGQETPQRGCYVENPGKEYEALAASTGGEVFDICQADWKPSFDRLTNSVNDIANNAFKLKNARVHKVLKVLLDGRELKADEYTLQDRSVIISAPLLVGASSLEVLYQYFSE